MKRTIKWLVVLSLLALPVFTAVARAPRPPRPVLTCDPGSVTSMRDLIWFTRHCKGRVVQEAEVTGQHSLSTDTPTATREYPNWNATRTAINGIYLGCKQVNACYCMGYPCPGETWVPQPTSTHRPTITLTPTYILPSYPPPTSVTPHDPYP